MHHTTHVLSILLITLSNLNTWNIISTRVIFTHLAVMMCCKNRFDQYTVHLYCVGHFFLTHFVPGDTIDFRAVTAKNMHIWTKQTMHHESCICIKFL